MGELLDKLSTAVTKGRDHINNPAFTVTEAEVAPLQPLLEQDAKAGGADLLAFFERAKDDLNIHIEPPVFGTFWKMVGAHNLPRGTLIQLEVRERTQHSYFDSRDREAVEVELREAYPENGFLEARFEFVEQIRANPGVVIFDKWTEEALGLEPATLKASELVDQGDEVADRNLQDIPHEKWDKVRNQRCRETLGFYRRAIAADPNYLRAYHAMSWAFQGICNDFDYSQGSKRRQDHQEARYQRLLPPLLRRNPRYAYGWHAQASYRYHRKDFEEARRAYEKFFTLQRPNDPGDYLFYGESLEKTGRLPEAHRAYEDCMDRDAISGGIWMTCVGRQLDLFHPVTDVKVEFEKGSSELRDDQKPALDRVADFLNKYPKLQRFQVKGHTGLDGEEADKLRLSGERAKVVRDYLVGKGVDPSVFAEVVGLGDQHYRFQDVDPDTGERVIHELVEIGFFHEPHPNP